MPFDTKINCCVFDKPNNLQDVQITLFVEGEYDNHDLLHGD